MKIKRRRFGALKGKIHMSENFDEPMELKEKTSFWKWLQFIQDKVDEIRSKSSFGKF